jgi:signal transduction histidine kinase
VNDIVRRVVTDLQGPGAALHMKLGDRSVVMGDALSLRRVLENLVDNAVDSLDAKPGDVTVTTTLVNGDAAGPRVQITVVDTGTGMTEEQQAQAFDDFYTTKSDGMGLGLSIVRRLVMDLDGSIRVESEKGKGTRFIVDLPASAAGEDT